MFLREESLRPNVWVGPYAMNAADTASGSSTTTDEKDDPRMFWMNRVFLGFILFGVVTALLSCPKLAQGPAAVLWSLACLAVGAFGGLLFGIPRARQKPAGDGQNGNSPLEVNNNLIEVSDWLTKIIVGLGLVELGSLPARLKTITHPLAASLGTEFGSAIATGIVVYFSMLGFLAGYLNARTFIAALLKRQEDMSLRSQMREVQQQVKRAAVTQQAQQVASEVKIQSMRELLTSQVESPEAAVQPGAGAPPVSTEPDPELLSMAKAYGDIDDKDYWARVRKKDKAASQMLRYIIKQKIPKPSLYAWTEAQPSDGLIVALASYTMANPGPDDLRPLLSAGEKAVWLHVKYRVTLALGTLFREGYGSADEWKQTLRLLDRYRDHADNRKDESLIALIRELTDMIATKQPPQP